MTILVRKRRLVSSREDALDVRVLVWHVNWVPNADADTSHGRALRQFGPRRDVFVFLDQGGSCGTRLSETDTNMDLRITDLRASSYSSTSTIP